MTFLPLPNHFDPNRTDEVYALDYPMIRTEGQAWGKAHSIKPASADKPGSRVALLNIDSQNTFCLPNGELAVLGAGEDNSRWASFVYRNLPWITHIIRTFDTHPGLAIHLPRFWADADGLYAPENADIFADDVASGLWKPSPDAVMYVAGGNQPWLSRYVHHYTQSVEEAGRYALHIWADHGRIGTLGWAQSSIVDEAIQWHAASRQTDPSEQIKGGHPLSENYSVFRPEVLEDHEGNAFEQRNTAFIEMLTKFDAVGIAGQAKSHCFAWSVYDLLNELMQMGGRNLVEKIHLIEDTTSPVVIPGVVDFTDQADKAFADFKDAGMHVVTTDMPIESWPGLN